MDCMYFPWASILIWRCFCTCMHVNMEHNICRTKLSYSTNYTCK
uniref:Uncharacterized protein n=1 Tax=Arundo donax TaxID=35708 RepID=A0A0A9CRN3_ARUDO